MAAVGEQLPRVGAANSRTPGRVTRQEQHHLPDQLDEETRVGDGGERASADARPQVGAVLGAGCVRRSRPGAREIEQRLQLLRQSAQLQRARPAPEIRQ